MSVFARTEVDLRADMDVRANVGLSPGDPEWIDTREGSFYFIATQPSVILLAAAYDRMNEILQAAIPFTSFDTHLDNHAISFGLIRKEATIAGGAVTITGVDGTLVPSGVIVSPVQTDPDIEPPEFETTNSGTIAGGTLSLTVQARTAGSSGNVPVAAISFLQTAVDGVATVTNLTATSGGTDRETDEALVRRIQAIFLGSGSGTVGDYTRWALNYPAVGRVTVVPVWDGPNTVQVIISAANGDSLPGATVTGLQNELDPVPGQGLGIAPIDHHVTVQTPTSVAVSVSATVELADGYALDSITGDIAVRSAIEESLSDYIDELAPGVDVIYNHVMAQFFRVEGVVNVSAVLVNGGTADIVIGSNPPQVAQMNAVTLS